MNSLEATGRALLKGHGAELATDNDKNKKNKSIKNVMRCGDSSSAKSIETR